MTLSRLEWPEVIPLAVPKPYRIPREGQGLFQPQDRCIGRNGQRDRPLSVTLYVTEWVIARGILVMQGKRASSPRDLREWYTLDMSEKDQYRRYKWALGNSVFLTLKDAEADALARWEEHASRMARLATEAAESLQKVRDGHLKVHTVGARRISFFHAFEGFSPEASPES